VAMAPLVDAAQAFYAAVGRGLGSPYEFWGRLFPPVYLGVAAGLLVLRRGADATGSARRAASLAIGASVVGAITDAGAYWSYGTPLQPILWSGGFAVELLALAVLGLAMVWLALAEIAAGRRVRGAILLAGLALVVPSMMAVDYMPHGALLPIVFAVAIAAFLGGRRARVAARQPAATGPA
jgi:hypothetical protein